MKRQLMLARLCGVLFAVVMLVACASRPVAADSDRSCIYDGISTYEEFVATYWNSVCVGDAELSAPSVPLRPGEESLQLVEPEDDGVPTLEQIADFNRANLQRELEELAAARMAELDSIIRVVKADMTDPLQFIRYRRVAGQFCSIWMRDTPNPQGSEIVVFNTDAMLVRRKHQRMLGNLDQVALMDKVIAGMSAAEAASTPPVLHFTLDEDR